MKINDEVLRGELKIKRKFLKDLVESLQDDVIEEFRGSRLETFDDLLGECIDKIGAWFMVEDLLIEIDRLDKK